MTTQALPAALLAFVVGLVVTKLVEVLGRRRGLLDVPNDRSSHVTPTPRIGGLGIIAGVICGWAVVGGWRDGDGIAYLIASVALGLVGLADDFGRASVLGKYLAQVVTSTVVALALGPTLAIQAFGASVEVQGFGATMLTILWLTALINAFNFLDGIDGMLAGLTIVTALVGIGLVTPGAAPNLLIVAAASLGFLVWNRAPASIFMGDVGSQFLGLWVGASALIQPGGVVGVVPLIILFGLILLDTGFTLVRRIREGKNLFAAHREHLYQRLVVSGASHRLVSALYGAITAGLGAMAIAWSTQTPAVQLAMAAALMVGALVLTAWVRQSERLPPT